MTISTSPLPETAVNPKAWVRSGFEATEAMLDPRVLPETYRAQAADGPVPEARNRRMEDRRERRTDERSERRSGEIRAERRWSCLEA